MPQRVRLRSPLPPLALLAAAGTLIAFSGCDLQENADKANGRELFVEKCGTCHALKEAGTKADVGPDLDQAFAQSRATGMDQDTFEGVIEAQIAFPRPASPEDAAVYMPANLVHGDDATDVAAYVASVAGVPGIEPPTVAGGPGAQVFATQGCGSCHTLDAANSSGTTGPDLDEVLTGQSAAQVTESIVNPDAKISSGFSAGIMPPFKELPPKELKDLVDFLLESGGGAKKK